MLPAWLAPRLGPQRQPPGPGTVVVAPHGGGGLCGRMDVWCPRAGLSLPEQV
ncbi:MAG: hypothetical protein OXC96_05530 [Cyanobacteria bacterium MAG CAR1_bin_15]|nr:hypothetical protein [Cyanobacteria bacterium MAG CAR1_bin_15]